MKAAAVVIGSQHGQVLIICGWSELNVALRGGALAPRLALAMGRGTLAARSTAATFELANQCAKAGYLLANGSNIVPGTQKAAEAATRAPEQSSGPPPKGGVYVLKDKNSGKVMRTGRSNDLARRRAEHQRSPETSDLEFKPQELTGDYATQRGLEQLRHDEYHPPLNKVRPISPRNPKRPTYLDTAKKYLDAKSKSQQNGR